MGSEPWIFWFSLFSHSIISQLSQSGPPTLCLDFIPVIGTTIVQITIISFCMYVLNKSKRITRLFGKKCNLQILFSKCIFKSSNSSFVVFYESCRTVFLDAVGMNRFFCLFRRTSWNAVRFSESSSKWSSEPSGLKHKIQTRELGYPNLT
jgi:hypothetical protein